LKPNDHSYSCDPPGDPSSAPSSDLRPDAPIPLTADIVFKYVFGSEGSTTILRSLLSAVQTDAGFPAVAEVSIENPFNLQDAADAKLSVVDVRAVDVTGAIFTVEVQAEREPGFLKRALYYWAAAYFRQLSTADPFTTLDRTVGVNLLDYRLFPDRSALHTAFVLTALNEPALRMTDDLLIHTIELPKLHIPGLNDRTAKDRNLSTSLGRWAYYLKQRGRKEAMEDPILLQFMRGDPEIQDAEARYQEFMADPQLRSRYRARQRFLHQQATNLEAARNEGIEQGRRETARRMKELGVTTAVITAATGLSESEVAELT
jgi:predicted transposase/invertase (TIGR01784 family)